MNSNDNELDLVGVGLPDSLEIEEMRDGEALAAAGTLGTTSTASSASCPVSTAGSVMCASSAAGVA